MSEVRRQLTLFADDQIIEKIRARFNPVQYGLINAHVTLCREDEIENIEQVIGNINTIALDKPLCLTFGSPERFENGKGLLIPGNDNNEAFDKLRQAVLNSVIKYPRMHHPHITLMHPRNSTCNDIIFDKIWQYGLPKELYFDKISLIEQTMGKKWEVIQEFPITWHFISKSLILI